MKIYLLLIPVFVIASHLKVSAQVNIPIDRKNMDMTVKPGDDFFRYVNGNWIKNNAVPPSKTRWGTFNMVAETNSQRLHELLEEAKLNRSDPKIGKLGDYYASGLDSAFIETLGFGPIVNDLRRISHIASIEDILNELAYQRINGISNSLISFNVAPDRKDVSRYAAQLSQGGITLPDRDYYIKDDARSVSTREAYKKYIQTLFRLSGQGGAKAEGKYESIMRIETALAKAQYSRVDMRDPYKLYNKIAVKDLSASTPSIDWKKQAERVMIKGIDTFIVSNPGFLKVVDSLLSKSNIADWKAYLEWNVLDQAAPYLSNVFVQANFKFNQVLSGQKEISQRWERVKDQIDRSTGDLLGEMFVKKYFTPQAKQRMLDLVNNLQKTFSERIKRLDWMSEATKAKAIQKLSAFTKKIGYTDKWRDYSGIMIDRKDYIGNVRRAARWQYNETLNQLGKPVDRTLWRFTPPTVNASYNSSNNDITFPAGILQFPFFDPNADDAINYGGIGAVIGHEITHGFDDQGRLTGADGNLSDWWTKDDADKFKQRGNMVVDQYNGYIVLDTLHVNGKLTLGENLADLGGLNIAFEAFTKTRQYLANKTIDGLTPAQRFFINWGQIWRTLILPEEQAKRILTDPHSPGEYRANGAVVNIDAWYDAFGVKAGDKMYKAPDKRIRIW